MAEILPGRVHDGNYKVSWVPTIADRTAPTTAELDAGISLECQITPDGLNREPSDEAVDDSRLCSTFNTASPGRTSYDLSVTLVRLQNEASDEAYTTLVKNAEGHLVVRDNTSADDPWAIADVVEVYPVIAGTRSKSTPAQNERQKFTVPFFLSAEPELEAVVA